MSMMYKLVGTDGGGGASKKARSMVNDEEADNLDRTFKL